MLGTIKKASAYALASKVFGQTFFEKFAGVGRAHGFNLFIF